MNRISYNGHDVWSAQYPDYIMRGVLDRAASDGVVAAARSFRVPTGIVCLWCRMAEIEYDLPKAENCAKTVQTKVVRDLKDEYHPIDIALWHGLSVKQVERVRHRNQNLIEQHIADRRQRQQEFFNDDRNEPHGDGHDAVDEPIARVFARRQIGHGQDGRDISGGSDSRRMSQPNVG